MKNWKIKSIKESSSGINIKVTYKEKFFGSWNKYSHSYSILRDSYKNKKGKKSIEVKVYDKRTGRDVTQASGEFDDDWLNKHACNVDFIRFCFGDNDPCLIHGFYSWLDEPACIDKLFLTKWFKKNPKYLNSYVKQVLDKVNKEKKKKK